MTFKVNFYKDKDTNEIFCFCQDCAKEEDNLEYIDIAGEFDFCNSCFVENISDNVLINKKFMSINT